MKDDTVYLRHIQDCIRCIEENVAEGRGRFLASQTDNRSTQGFHVWKTI